MSVYHGLVHLYETILWGDKSLAYSLFVQKSSKSSDQ